MSYQEKRTIVSIITGALIIASYCFYAFGRYQSGAIAPDDIKFWAGTMLVFIGIGMAVTIVIQIAFHILLAATIAVSNKLKDDNCDEKEIEKSIGSEIVEDEMGKVIELKSSKVGMTITGLGFVAGLVALVLNSSAAVMLNILFLSIAGGSIIEGFVQLYYYRKGVTYA